MLLAKPLSRAVLRQPRKRAALGPRRRKNVAAPAVPKHLAERCRSSPARETGILVLNGNGRTGAASASRGARSASATRVPRTGNAARHDYATTVVMYPPRLRAPRASGSPATCT